MTSPPQQPPITPGYADQPPRGDWTPPQPKSRATPWLIGILALLVAVVAGLGITLARGSDPEPADGAPEAAAAVTSSAPEPEATSAPTTAVAVAGQAKLKLGQVHSFTADGDKVAVSALAHKRYSDYDAKYEAVQVRTCNKGTDTFPVSTLPWLLSYGAGEELSQDTVTGGGLATPEFTERDLAPGKCAKGWISWVPAKSGKPDGVEYRIEGYTSARWEW